MLESHYREVIHSDTPPTIPDGQIWVDTSTPRQAAWVWSDVVQSWVGFLLCKCSALSVGPEGSEVFDPARYVADSDLFVVDGVESIRSPWEEDYYYSRQVEVELVGLPDSKVTGTILATSQKIRVHANNCKVSICYRAVHPKHNSLSFQP